MRFTVLLRSIALSLALIVPGAPWAAPDGGETLQSADGEVANPQLESKVAPEDSPAARDAGLEASIVLQAMIRKDGAVDQESIRCLRCSVRRQGEDPEEVLHGWCDDFGAASVDAVAQWRYTPGPMNGEPADVYFTIVVQFELP